MRLEQFFEKFELFADAPNAVAKMRELVLELAVQGKLVEQSATDDSSDELTATIAAERAAYIKAKSLSRQRSLSPVSEDEYPNSAPVGWRWTRLGNLSRVQAGFAFTATAFTQGDSGIPIIRIRDIRSNHTQINYLGEYRSEFLVNPGDYLVGMDGNFNVAKWNGPKALLNQRVSRLQWYSKQLEPSFFAIALQYRLTDLQGKKAYTTVDHLSSKQIEDAVVPLPPLAEQKRIVAKVDELMALCDRLEAQQQERDTRHATLARASLTRFAEAPTPANLDFLFHHSYPITPADFRKAILSLAVQGKLVPQDANDKPAIRLDSAIDAEETPHELPIGWGWCRLGGLNPSFQNGASSRGDRDGIPVVVLRLADIVNRRISLRNTRELRIEPNQAAKYSLRTGDILITRVNGSADIVGRFVLVEADLNAIYCDHFIRMRIEGDIAFPRYMELLGATEVVRDQIAGLFITTAGQKTVNQGHISSLLIALPPLAEQRRIVAKVDQLMALVDQLETQLATSHAVAEKLMEAAVAELTTEV